MKVGGSDIKGAYLGAVPAGALYLGAEKLWPSGSVIKLAGAATAVSSGSAALSRLKRIAGGMLSLSAADGAIIVGRGVEGEAQASSSLSGAAGVARQMVGGAAASSGALGRLSVSGQVILAGGITATSLLDGALIVGRPLVAGADAVSAGAGASTVLRRIAGGAIASAALAGSANMLRHLTGSSEAVSQSSADLTVTAPGGGYSFTMTAGNFSGAVFGYSDGSSFGFSIGSIDQEPIPGETLKDFMYATVPTPGTSIGFSGNILGLVSGKSVWIDGVEYPFTDDWSLNGGDTIAGWTSGYPVFADSESYFVEIK